MQIVDDLVAVMKKLRSECPWDKEQSLETLRTYLLEESYECLDAMDQAIQGKKQPLYEELGDLFLQILFQAEILSEQDRNSALEEILVALKEKLVRRHPHVFAKGSASTAKEVKEKWDEIKRKEKSHAQEASIDAGIPRVLPSLSRALKLGKKAEKWKFDWESDAQIWSKIKEELGELEKAQGENEQADELGDIFFCLVQWARHKNLDPEMCLDQANKKFVQRFEQMKICSTLNDEGFKALSLQKKEELWQSGKRVLREKSKQSN